MKKHRLIIFICFTLFIGVLTLTASPSEAVVPYESYIYDYWRNPVPTPHAYIPERTIKAGDLGIDELDNPRDIFVSHDKKIYIADAGIDSIIIADKDWNLVGVIDEFDNEGERDSFDNPRGVFVTEQGHMLVADMNNARIVEFDNNGELVNIIESPKPDVEGIIRDGFRFRPRNLAVDRAGRLYVVSQDEYDGIMGFDVDGNFRGFIGAPRVSPSPMDVFWHWIATDEQRERRELFLPTEFSNITLDERGFIYTTVADVDAEGEEALEEPVRKLNPTGIDVLRRSGFVLPIGDIISPRFLGPDSDVERSRFGDVAARENGIFSVLDRERGRVFTYDSEGNLMYVFGGSGNYDGTFTRPVAIENLGSDIMVLDARTRQITVFRETEYAAFIHSAIDYYHSGEYDRATEMWNNVLTLNTNYDLAYSGIARSQLRAGNFYDAMVNYRLGNDRAGYSEAFGLYRRQVMAQHFGTIMGIIFLSIIMLYLLIKYKLHSRLFSLLTVKYAKAATTSEDLRLGSLELEKENNLGLKVVKVLESLRYSTHVIFHPFGGFWDLKHEKKGNVQAASIILALVSLTYVFMMQYEGFIFNPRDIRSINIFMEVGGFLFPFALWCIVNWSLTTLMEGKGSIKDIYIASCFALTPIFLINVPMTVISNYLTADEGAFYNLLIAIGVLWAVTLLISGTMVIHDYTMPKTLGTVVFILIGMATVIFVGLLFIVVLDVLRDFFNDIYTELIFRM